MSQPPPSVTAPQGNWGPYPANPNGPGGGITQLNGSVLAGPGASPVAAEVVALDETSGPSKLAIQAIPGDVNMPTFIARLADSLNIGGFNLPFLGYARLVVSYYFNLAATDLFGVAGAGGWLAPGLPAALVAHNIGMPVPFAAYGWRLMMQIAANTIDVGAQINFDMTQNGVAPGGGGGHVNFAGGATGQFDSGILLGEASTIDDNFGLVGSQNVELAAGSVEGTTTLWIY